ncbi:MAG: GGDEF domain-containing protein, partial [Spirochaetota bacterium]
LRGVMRSSDTVARVGGDEFVIVLTNVRESSDIDLAMVKIEEVVSRPFRIADEECSVGLSIGVATFPDDGASIEEILGRADAAMYATKAEHKTAREGLRLASGGAIQAPGPVDSVPMKKGRGNRR